MKAINKPSFISELDWKALNKSKVNLKRAIRKIKKNYPVQYLIGNVNFYGNEIIVNKNVLIPRFETEGLVEKTILLLKKYSLTDTGVLEIGTGSGCIPITLKKELPELIITSIDKSKNALKVAKLNSKKNKVDINFIHKNVKRFKPINKYGLLISNPPYVDELEEVDPQIKYEPKKAIYAKDNGLEYYKYILKVAPKWLDKKNILAFEIGYNQGKELKKISKMYFPQAKISIEKDLSGKDRYLFIINE